MTAQEFADLVLELNDSLDGNKYLENIGVGFEYRTNYYCDQILFGDFVVYCSENDSLYDYETDKEITVKEAITKNLKDFIKALKTIKL
jgi:hypothetical protein